MEKGLVGIFTQNNPGSEINLVIFHQRGVHPREGGGFIVQPREGSNSIFNPKQAGGSESMYNV